MHYGPGYSPPQTDRRRDRREKRHASGRSPPSHAVSTESSIARDRRETRHAAISTHEQENDSEAGGRESVTDGAAGPRSDEAGGGSHLADGGAPSRDAADQHRMLHVLSLAAGGHERIPAEVSRSRSKNRC